MSELLPLVGRLLLGAVLVVAGGFKLRDRVGFAASVRAFGFVPRVWIGAVATVLPLVELCSGALLLTGIFYRLATLVSIGLLLVFTGGIAGNLLRGKTAPCACFGTATARRLGPSALVRNLALLTAGIVVAALSSAGNLSAVSYLAAVLIVGLLTVGWQLIVTTVGSVPPVRALSVGGWR